jgi:1,4-dihydroxy-2-naphthoate octaprenyltransferase
MRSAVKIIKAWCSLSRLPFYIVAVLPFILGNLLARNYAGQLDWTVLSWGFSGMILILLSTHYMAEFFDYEADIAAAKLGKSKFSGGSQILQSGIISRRQALAASIIALVMALIVGILMRYHYKTGAFTIPLGTIGIIGGLFYSAKPFQWSYRGLGEIWVGICYSWLIIATAFYIQTGKITELVHWVSIPIGLSIFNVILINQFPDYQADRKVGKRNLVVRFGKRSSIILYSMISAVSWLSYIFAVKAGIPAKAFWLFLPIFFLSFVTISRLIRSDYNKQVNMDRICGNTIIINIGITISFILALWL